MHMITENILVGGIEDAQKPPAVVGTLLLVAEEFSLTPVEWVDYHRIPFREFAKVDPAKLMEAVQWLESRVPNGRALVCCRAGMGRSVSVVMAYLCCVEGKPYDDALRLVIARRPGAMPLPNLQVAIEQVRQLRRAGKSVPSGS
jgi:protein-tyrosine phosphatase